MKKKKIPKTNAMRKLDQIHVPYEVHEYAWSEDHLDAAHVLKEMEKDAGAVYKTIVTQGDRNGINVAVIPALAKLDLKEFARVTDNKSIHLLPLNELEETTGYIRGGCSPIGMKKAFPTYLAAEMAAEEKILISAGKRGVQIGIKPADLVAVTHAKEDSFIVQEDKKS